MREFIRNDGHVLALIASCLVVAAMFWVEIQSQSRVIEIQTIEILQLENLNVVSESIRRTDATQESEAPHSRMDSNDSSYGGTFDLSKAMEAGIGPASQDLHKLRLHLEHQQWPQDDRLLVAVQQAEEAMKLLDDELNNLSYTEMTKPPGE